MHRRDLLEITTTLGLFSVLSRSGQSRAAGQSSAASASSSANVLTPPADGRIPVAFLLSEDAVVIDFAGPWEVFRNVHVSGPKPHPFELYTVAETAAPIHAGGSMTIIPNFTFANAPQPKVLVIPAQSDPSDTAVSWIRKVTASTDVTMSVCTGAFVLAKTGLLDGKPATTHHGAYADLAMARPEIIVRRGARYVETGNLASSGGLSSGIDLALHVVERYYGRAVAQRTTDNLEYQGLGWLNPDSNSAYAKRRVSTDERPLCAVCDMDVDRATAPKSTFRAHTYYFCMDAHKALFDRFPERFLA